MEGKDRMIKLILPLCYECKVQEKCYNDIDPYRHWCQELGKALDFNSRLASYDKDGNIAVSNITKEEAEARIALFCINHPGYKAKIEEE